MRAVDIVQHAWSRGGVVIREMSDVLSIPSVQISWSNIDAILRSNPSTSWGVSIKADGQRCRILCDLSGDCFAVLRNDRPGGTFLGRAKNYTGGVLLDCERVKVGESYTFLCFDLLALAHRAVPSTLVERNNLMTTVLAGMSLPKVFCKALYPASLWETVMIKDYPYNTDGLVFTANESTSSGKVLLTGTNARVPKRKHKCFKLKPQRNLTIDVLLGHYPISESNDTVVYQIYVKEAQTNQVHGGGGGSDEGFDLGGRGRVRGGDHDRGGGGDGDTRCSDCGRFMHEHEGVQANNVSWFRCLRCNEAHEEGSDGSSVRIVECRHTSRFDHNVLRHETFPSTVELNLRDVPRIISRKVVELRWNSDLRVWKFVRIRPDKYHANSAAVVDALLELIQVPMSVAHAASRLLNSSAAPTPANSGAAAEDEKVGPLTCSSEHSRVPPTRPKAAYFQGTSDPEFRHLRLNHKRVKAALCSLFGGNRRLLDLCCGKLPELDAWNRNGMLDVIAVDNDQAALEIASGRAQATTRVDVQICKCDLSLEGSLVESFGRQGANMADMRHSVDAVFCHFAIHYFFESEESTDVFIRNALPLLQDQCSFVVTFMEAEDVRNCMPLVVRDKSGGIAFSILPHHDDHGDAIDVFVKSIGSTHQEYLVDSEELMRRFMKHGLTCSSGIFPFHQLSELSGETMSHEMSDDERKVSALYRCAVFHLERSELTPMPPPQPLPANQERAVQAPLTVSVVPLFLVLPFLGIEDIRMTALASFSFYQAAEALQIPNPAAYFDELPERIMQPMFASIDPDGPLAFAEAMEQHQVGVLMHLFGHKTISEFTSFVRRGKRYIKFEVDRTSRRQRFFSSRRGDRGDLGFDYDFDAQLDDDDFGRGDLSDH